MSDFHILYSALPRKAHTSIAKKKLYVLFLILEIFATYEYMIENASSANFFTLKFQSRRQGKCNHRYLQFSYLLGNTRIYIIVADIIIPI